MKPVLLYSVFFLLMLQQYSCAQTQPITDSSNNSIPETILNINQAPEKFIAGNYSLLEVDNLNYIYLLGESGQLKKFYPNGDSLSIFNDVKKWGNPDLLDVSNPLKVLLFYKSYATIVSLDKMLTLRYSLNLRKQNIFSVAAIANAYDNNIWLFDEQDFTLKKITEQGNLLQATNDMRLFPGFATQVISITDHNNLVYLYDKELGFFIFDYYGSFKTRLLFKNWSNISFSGNLIYGIADSLLHVYHIDLQKEIIYKLPSQWKNSLSMKAMNGKLYLLKKEGLEIYNL